MLYQVGQLPGGVKLYADVETGQAAELVAHMVSSWKAAAGGVPERAFNIHMEHPIPSPDQPPRIEKALADASRF